MKQEPDEGGRECKGKRAGKQRPRVRNYRRFGPEPGGAVPKLVRAL